ncbi:MAG: YihY family inner membrane protein, partial [Proteobacteria bacterium]|nr:YihY family inner membrane protein [Pseudomonadota bacterium]
MSSRIQRYSEHIAAEQKRFILTRMRHEPWYRRAFYTCLSFAQVIYDEVMENRLFVRASGAAYTTVLALVPFLVVGGSFVVMFNKQASLAEIITHINDWVVPVAGDTLATILADNLARTLDIGLGPVGAIFLVVTSVMLFIHIEDTLNFIWHVRKSRPLHLRVLLFYAVVTLGPLLVSYSIYQAAQFFDDLGGASVLWGHTRSLLIAMALFYTMFQFLP